MVWDDEAMGCVISIADSMNMIMNRCSLGVKDTGNKTRSMQKYKV